MMYPARIIINDKITNRKFSHKQLIQLFHMGAMITVWIDGCAYLMENIIAQFDKQTITKKKEA